MTKRRTGRTADEVRESLRAKKAVWIARGLFEDDVAPTRAAAAPLAEWAGETIAIPAGRCARLCAALLLAKLTGHRAEAILAAATHPPEVPSRGSLPITLGVRIPRSATACGRDGAYRGDELIELVADGGRHELAKRLRSLAETIVATTGAPVQSAVVAVLLRFA